MFGSSPTGSFWTLGACCRCHNYSRNGFSPSWFAYSRAKNIAASGCRVKPDYFPYLFFVSLAALAMGILNCFNVFGLPAATPDS